MGKEDLIRRQDAIEELRDVIVKDVQFGDELTDGYNDGIDMAITVISKLPSAQPDRHCNTCRYRNLEWYEEPCDSCTMGGESNHYKPSAQHTGKWLRYGEDGNPNEEDTVFWQCDQCLETYTGRTTRIPNFCPNCGADMRGECIYKKDLDGKTICYIDGYELSEGYCEICDRKVVDGK